MKSMNKAKSKKCGISFLGSTIVGERGQVVIPKELRKENRIRPGDRVIFLGTGRGPIILIRSDLLNKFLVHISKRVEKLKKTIA